MVTTAVQKALRRRSPPRPAPLPAPSEPLEQLRRQIAAIRVRSAAARQAAMGSIPDNAPLVPVFEVPLTNYEALVGDRDVEKREERIRAVLNERKR